MPKPTTSFRRRTAAFAAAGLLAPLALFAQAPPPQGLQQRAAPPARPVPPPPAPSAAELAGVPADAQWTGSGLAYKVLRTGVVTETPPLDKDIVAIFVIGRSPSGEVFQDSFAQGKPQRMQVKNAFTAWRDAMKSMLPGEVRRWWFPADQLPPNPKTGRKEPAVFDVELVSVGRMPDPPRSVSRPDPRAKTLPSGAAYLQVTPGTGDQQLTRKDGAMVSFTFWNSDGRAINSSIAEGRPTLFPMEKVMPAFADCLMGMKVGEKRHCWIPAERNEGFPGAPSGALVFELDLLGITDFQKMLQGKAAPPPPAAPHS
jgi:FKBP-type peptidyl-prolyl cis-trans isomerase